MNFSDLVVALRLNISQFTSAMNTARQQAQRFSSAMAQASTAGSADALIQGYTTLNDRLHRVGLGLRDIARISSGIVVSQTFYGIARSIEDATDALSTFIEALDYANVAYSALFNDSNLAGDFLDTLQQFSVDTIFKYQDLEKMARKLLAYGIEYKNLMFIIEGLTNIGTMSGDTAALERLAVAIGQIKAKGVLQAEEVRQLVNAYAPMHDILREKFGLTDEDFENLGDLRLPADDVINAIVEYANEQFGAVSEAAMLTLTGLKNRITDSLKVMGAEIMQPVTTFYKSLLKFTADQLNAVHDVYKSSGLGGVFEHIIPSEEWQGRLRQLVANIKNFVSVVIAQFMTMWPVISQVFGGILDAINMLLAVINVAASGIVAAIQSISGHTPILNILTKALITAAAAWALFRIQALGAAVISGLRVVLLGVANAVLFLSRALMSNPILTLLTLLGAVMIGVAANANNADSAISKLMRTLNSYSVGGETADSVLQVGEAMEEGTTNSDQFWESMGEGAEDAADSADEAAKKAAKAAKGLLSFDEVFKLPEKSGAAGGAGAGDLSGIGDLAEALSGLGTALIPEIPDLSTYAKDFVSSLYNDLWDAMKSIASGAATGAVIGGLVGFAIGGLVTRTMAGALEGAKWGAKIGALAGAGFAAFWTDTYKEMEGTLSKIAIGGSIGALAGGLVGMIVGAFATRTIDGALLGAKYGAAIGSLAGAGIGGFWAAATEKMENAIEALAAGGTIGALIGGLVGFVLGAFSTKTLQGAVLGGLHGATIGTLIGGAISLVFGDFEKQLDTAIGGIMQGGAVGLLAGAVTGLLIGAFATKSLAGALTGAKYGMLIGGLLGGTLGGLFSKFEKSLQDRIAAIAWGGAEGMITGGLVGMVLGAFATRSLKGALTGAKYGAAIGGLVGAGLGGFFGDTEKTLTERFQGMFSNISAASTGALIGGLAGMVIGAVVGAFAGGIGALPGAKAGAVIGAGVGGLVSLLTSYLANSGATAALADWLGTLWNTIAKWFSDTGNNIKTWSSEFFTKIKKWFSDVWTNISNWFRDLKSNFKTWWDSLTDINTWKTAWSNVQGWFSDLWTKISEWFTKLKNGFVTWWNSLTIVQGWKTGWSNVATWFSNLFSSVGEWFSNTRKSVKTWWESMFNPNTWKSAWSSISSWFTDLYKGIKGWFGDIGKSVGNWWDGLWDGKEVSVDTSSNRRGGGGNFSLAAHAKGGIFNREHIARFAEGNKAEAIIPLEDNVAMRPFVNAISDGILQGLLPAMSNGGSSNDLPPMYVGTLIADERGIQQLYNKFKLYEAKEMTRKGLA